MNGLPCRECWGVSQLQRKASPKAELWVERAVLLENSWIRNRLQRVSKMLDIFPERMELQRIEPAP